MADVKFMWNTSAHHDICKYVDGQFDGIFVPREMVEGEDLGLYSEYRAALEAGLVEDYTPDTDAYYLKLIADGQAERFRIINSPITINNVPWDVDEKSRDNIRNAVEVVDRNPGIDPTTTWILADNSLRQTDVHELKSVLDAYTLRMGEVFEEYTIWLHSSPTGPFVYKGKYSL